MTKDEGRGRDEKQSQPVDGWVEGSDEKKTKKIVAEKDTQDKRGDQKRKKGYKDEDGSGP